MFEKGHARGESVARPRYLKRRIVLNGTVGFETSVTATGGQGAQIPETAQES